MPIDSASKSTRSYRRVTAEDALGMRTARQREMESKRARGEVACAECRRLKLRCNRKVPCSTCVRRGCHSICPNGTLSGQGTRFILTDTNALHRKIAQMSERIRQLEESLEILQNASSSTRHPLLSDELLTIKFGVDAADALSNPQSENEDRGDEDPGLLDALGTLTISESGASRFIGPTGGSESLLVIGEDEESNIKRPIYDIPSVLSNISETWPFTNTVNGQKEDLLLKIKAQLPPWERAWALCEAYIENQSLFLRTVQRSQIVEELLPSIYQRNVSGPTNANAAAPFEKFVEPTETNAHDLAAVFMVFAVGAMCDLALPPDNDEAELYHQLARAALGLRNVFDTPSLAAVQAIGLMSVYLGSCGRRRTLEGSWLTMNLASNLAISIGLHRDPARWNVSPRLAERRRAVFWELFAEENWMSLANGRPSTFALRFVDCKYPEYTQTPVSDDEPILPDFWKLKYQFSKDFLSEVAYKTSSAKPPKYSEVLDLDRKARAFFKDHGQQVQIPAQAPGLGNRSPMVDLQVIAVSLYQDVTMLYIHRNFFMEALMGHPANPLLSPYATSFLAAYRSATQILKAMNVHFDWFPSLLSRFWPLWAQSISAAVIVGSVVTRGPSSSLASAALAELVAAVGLFEKAEAYVPMLKRAVPVFIRLRGKARDAYSKYQSGCGGDVGGGTQEAEEQDELSIVGGQTRFVSTKEAKSTPTSGSSPSSLDDEARIANAWAAGAPGLFDELTGTHDRHFGGASWTEDLISSPPMWYSDSEGDAARAGTVPAMFFDAAFSDLFASPGTSYLVGSEHGAAVDDSCKEDAWTTFMRVSSLLG